MAEIDRGVLGETSADGASSSSSSSSSGNEQLRARSVSCTSSLPKKKLVLSSPSSGPGGSTPSVEPQPEIQGQDSESLLAAIVATTTKSFKRSTTRLLHVLQSFSAAGERRLLNLLQSIMHRISVIDEDLKMGRMRIDLLDLRIMLLLIHTRFCSKRGCVV
jgi:hypothetical protein